MGFLDRVKAGFSQAAGGMAALQLELSETMAAPGDEIDFRVVLVTNGPLKAQSVTVGLYGRERVRVWTGAPSLGVGGDARAGGRNGAPPLSPATARETITFQQAAPVVPGEVTLPAGQTREYRGHLTVPVDAQPTYSGQNAQHTWWVRAVAEIPLGEDLIQEREVRVR